MKVFSCLLVFVLGCSAGKELFILLQVTHTHTHAQVNVGRCHITSFIKADHFFDTCMATICLKKIVFAVRNLKKIHKL